MNQQDTLALYERAEAARSAAKAEGKDNGAAHAAATGVWNDWANDMLAKQRKLESAGTWAAEKDVFGSLEPKNPETTEWFAAAEVVFSTAQSTHTFDRDVRCNGWIFPGLARFDKATFTGAARFERATFTGTAGFGGATFTGAAGFRGATFTSTSGFDKATFTGDASFRGATFTGAAGFRAATLKGEAGFGEATFTGDARFDKATFAGTAWFDKATFAGNAWFDKATFAGTALFDKATFSSVARFDKALFTGTAFFREVTFVDVARFGQVAFAGDARFGTAKFEDTAWFAGATFSGDARYDLAKFNGYTTFANTRFSRAAEFNAVKGDTAFTLEGARFREVPDFIQANFVQAPRLDNVIVRPALAYAAPADASRLRRTLFWPRRFGGGLVKRLFRGDANVPARYRSLKRLAIQGHDLEREQMFHAGEIRAARFATDWPLHWKLWSKEGWTSIWRFWFGLVYELLSDFGRSVMRPAIAWLVLLLVSAAIYLGANPDMTRERERMIAGGASTALAYAETTIAAWHRNHACVATSGGVQGLPDAVRGVTSAVTEALHLSFANGAVLGDVGSPDTGTRTYGCLYGLAPTTADTRLSIVPYPGIVATISKIQRFVSALLIFLFGLAVRNMLKMK